MKIAPDLDDGAIRSIAEIVRRERMDGIIATNTTVARADVGRYPNGLETGGLSGAPLRERSAHVIRMLSAALGGEIPIIGVGGILSGADAVEKIDAGATLVQLYTGLIYRGPALVDECIDAIRGTNRPGR